jgi:signal peptidase I
LKRIVGLAGEELRFEDGQLHVDGDVIDEPYLDGLPPTLGLGAENWRLGAEEYFVMGDNRVRSTDSREYGPVGADLLVGKARLRYWPPLRWGAVR